MVINGRIIGQHSVRNGVKQGDALSCTLFILAIEPLLKNIEKNSSIKSLESKILRYKWPKVLGYADDISCIMENTKRGKQALFTEYERFSKISGLLLNADKTEIYNFGDDRRDNRIKEPDKVTYREVAYTIAPVPEIKINGVILCQNRANQKVRNCEILIQRMERHFANWSKRQLTLLGKIQIYKTFGISQFLYHLAVIEPDPAH